MQAIAMVRLYENKPLQNAFKSTIYTYSILTYKLCNISIILFLKNNLTNICSEINTYNNMKSSGKYGRRGEGECTFHR